LNLVERLITSNSKKERKGVTRIKEGQTIQGPQDTKGVTRIKEGQTTQWPQDTKGVIRICKEGQTTQ
jgi:hypothetical protein